MTAAGARAGEVWIVRHGDTFAPGEPVRRIGARCDPPLAPTGRAQALALAEALRAVRFDLVRRSAQRRARETAAPLLAAAGLPARTAGWLCEIDHGPDEGRTEAEVLARLGADALADWDRDAVSPPGWIVGRDARLAGWRRWLHRAAQRGDTRLAVTSNGAARFALLADPALAAQAAALPSLKLRTGAWGRLVHGADGWRIAEWDRRP